ncbi:unnamed protein product [Lactuca virosa]|uniref:non-specific serine/threonine protein kinase n=1 Tax=Lactuca virosa TaxID=75947 RepID=A0AAU9MHZ9_9ASTR|nr:unnamed protein product [Lactuca virosa]
MDPCLRGRILPTCLEAFVEIADRCILKCPKARPTMAEVVARLEYAFALQKGIEIDTSAVDRNNPTTTDIYNNSSEDAVISSEVQEVISHRYSSTHLEVTTADNGSSLHSELMNRDSPSASVSRMQKFIGQTKKKRIVRKIWSIFSAKPRANPGGGLSSESSVLLDDIHGGNIEASRFELDIIKSATQNFSEDNKIRQCATSSMYKGRLQNGQGIAVKRFHTYSQQVLREYKNEIQLLAKLEHDNVVQLLGYCVEGTHVVLVYGLAVYTSLDLLIYDFSSRVLLDWNRRHQIILGVAFGLRYIHSHASFQIVHCDVQSANILLEESLNPKLSDFGLATTHANNETEMHVAKDIMRNRECSPTADVFRFGLLILEIIRGQRSDEDFIHYVSITMDNEILAT